MRQENSNNFGKRGIFHAILNVSCKFPFPKRSLRKINANMLSQSFTFTVLLLSALN